MGPLLRRRKRSVSISMSLSLSPFLSFLLFLFQLLERFRESDDHASSVAELDAALLELSRTSLVPQVGIFTNTLAALRPS